MEEKRLDTTSQGRPAIEEGRYHVQIEQWLNDGNHIDAITATKLQKAVGGAYVKAKAILENFKAGYEQKEIPELPELSEAEQQEAYAILQKLIRLIHSSDLAEKKQMADNHKKNIDAKNNSIKELETRVQELIDIETELKNELNQKQQTIDNMDQQLSDLKKTNEQIKEYHHKDNQELLQKRILVTEQGKRIDERDEHIGKLETEKGQLQQSVSDTLERVEQIEKECRGLMEKNEQTVKDKNKMEKELSEAKSKLGRQIEVSETLKSEINDYAGLKDAHNVLIDDHKDLVSHSHQTEIELGKSAAKIQGLEDQLKTLKELLKEKVKASTKTTQNEE